MDALATFSRDLSALSERCAGRGPRPGLDFIPSAQRVGRKDMQPGGFTSSLFAARCYWYPPGRGALLLL